MTKTVKYSLKGITARDISEMTKGSVDEAHKNFDAYAVLLSRTVVEAPEDVTSLGPLDDPETYLSLPIWVDEDDDTLIFSDLVEGFGEALGKVQKTTKKR